MRKRVIKLGGSLLSAADLTARINHWLTTSTSHQNILLVGGGPLVDVIRNWDQRHRLSESYCHWASIRMMSETARLMHELLPDFSLCDQVESIGRSPNLIFDPMRFMQDVDHEPSWQITSDTIAALLAGRLQADLVLLKPTLPDSTSLTSWSQTGITDQAFAEAAGKIPQIEIVNLCDSTFPRILAD